MAAVFDQPNLRHLISDAMPIVDLDPIIFDEHIIIDRINNCRTKYALFQDAVRCGNLYVVRHLARIGLCYNTKGAIIGAELGNRSIIEYFKPDDKNIRIKIAGAAVQHGNIDIAYAYMDNDDFGKEYLVSKAIAGGQMEPVSHLEEKNPQTDTYALINHMKTAATYNHMDILKFYENKIKDIAWDTIVYKAAQSGSLEMVEYCISKGATTWNNCLWSAAGSGNLDLVKYFEAKGCATWNYALETAAQHGHLHIVKYCMEKLIPCWKSVIVSAIREAHIHIMDYAISMGFDRWRDALLVAAKYEHFDLLKEYEAKMVPPPDLDTWNICAIHSVVGGYHIPLDYCISKGANNWEELLEHARIGDITHMIRYIESHPR